MEKSNFFFWIDSALLTPLSPTHPYAQSYESHGKAESHDHGSTDGKVTPTQQSVRGEP
jgi:hypothetical protein